MSYVTKALMGLSVAGVAALILLTVADVLGRHFFASPIGGTVEVTEVIMVVIVFLALPRAEELDEQITVDLVHDLLEPRWRVRVWALAQLLSIPLLVLIAWRLSQHMFHLRTVGQTIAVLGLPLYPFVGVASVGMAAYAAVATWKLVTRWRARSDPEASGHPDGSARGEGQ
jgi:TRAP-type C4-dicarboxylate transport system permease small subunit